MPKRDTSPDLQGALKRIEDAHRTSATKLSLSRMGLTAIPEAIVQLSNLQELDLGDNQIVNVPEFIGQLSQLRVLNLRENKLNTLPESVTQLKNLQALSLHLNQIEVVPDSIIQFSELQELNLGGNRLGTIPEVVTLLTSLRSLWLWDNQITVIPESIVRLSDLRKLYLNRNEIRVVPSFISQLSNLKEIYLWGNRIGSVPDGIAALFQLHKLDLSRNKVTAIPESIRRLRELHYLRLDSNRLTEIPEGISQLSQLQFLDLSDNLITQIPESMRSLSGLEELRLSHNQITVIPQAIAELSQLRTLWMSRNKITVIPDSIGRLNELRELDLAQNNIQVVPSSIGQLLQLKHFDLSSNQIQVIPESVADLSKLEWLDLTNNRISTVPQGMVRLKKLTALFLHDNPDLGIPTEILGPSSKERRFSSRPPLAILAYLAKAEDSKPLNEAKLILVGQGAVGKTSLVKALTTGKFKKGEKTTEGIKISDWPCRLNRKNTATVHTWDFGGQEMMHATHQFFLTQRSLYLLVLNRRTGGVDREADYWFRLIRAFGGKSAPVIVVLNKQKLEPFDVNREGWLQKYRGNIKGFVATDCESKKTITQLKRKVIEELGAMKSLKERFPRRWFAIKDELSQMALEHISFGEYQKLCQKHGESDPASQSSLAGFLHDLGIALNYRQDPRLRFNYVLKPEWVTEGIYALLHAFVRQQGVFTQFEAETFLAEKKYSAEDTHFLLGLMERFELSFPLGDKYNRALIPELLADQQPKAAAEFDPAQCLNFGYKYPILPEGLLPRFIARTHHLGQPDKRWKTGVILEDTTSNCRALVRADATESEVRVHISGPQEGRPELLGIIRYNFEVIHSDYEFTPEAQVFPSVAPQKALSVEELKALAIERRVTVPVVLPDKTVFNQDIASLIDPLATPEPLKLFLSYSHLEESAINELRKDLRVMERNGLIRPWHDRSLTAGELWEPSILQELNAADMIVCQISRNYLASDNCVAELNAAIARNQGGKAALAAYVLTESGWKEFPGLSKLQVLPTDGKPLSDWLDPNKYWRAVTEGIQKAIKKHQAERIARSLASGGNDIRMQIV